MLIHKWNETDRKGLGLFRFPFSKFHEWIHTGKEEQASLNMFSVRRKLPVYLYIIHLPVRGTILFLKLPRQLFTGWRLNKLTQRNSFITSMQCLCINHLLCQPKNLSTFLLKVSTISLYRKLTFWDIHFSHLKINTDNALKWFRSYLYGRSQSVVIGDKISSARDLKFGVPQGSIPLLFIMYLAPLQDITLSHNLNCMFYADDTQTHRSTSIWTPIVQLVLLIFLDHALKMCYHGIQRTCWSAINCKEKPKSVFFSPHDSVRTFQFLFLPPTVRRIELCKCVY